jgi:Ribbon-helix-helix protein, copG family
MRTTIRIDDALYRRAKAHAARTGRTVSEVIEDAVRETLRPRPARAPKELPVLPVYGGSGVIPGVEIADSRALRDRMDEGEDLVALR